MSDGLSFDLTIRHPGLDLRLWADLPARGVTALVGASGAGKTSLLRALAGVLPATGPITLNGDRLDPLPAHRRGVGLVFQGAMLFPHLSVAENIAYGAQRAGTPGPEVERVVQALDVGPLISRAPDTLSGGEARRVALARTLAARPRLLLLDEPLAGLDPARKRDILPYLARAIRSAGCPALFVTHDTNESLALADRQLRIAGGRISDTAMDTALIPGRVARDGAGATLHVAGQTVPMPFAAREDEPWGLVVAPGRATFLGGDGPRVTDAPAVLPARIVSVASESVTVDIDGARIDWPLPDAATKGLQTGDSCAIALQTPIFRLVSET
ncbi:ABC transporter [Palleronia salina]|uniref:ABC transporter n=1 Tax=Palleronia salina TaxID=313368 RepID=A0A1M6AUI5_9RHOB|nr:ATP-binding cassette domain-containing protein [Palleronia salina]SHI40122.1 ABC transporter [Palleronia salina]